MGGEGGGGGGGGGFYIESKTGDGELEWWARGCEEGSGVYIAL
jgi:hypothetical protein